MRIPVVIQARMGSSRLPGKVLMLLDDRPVLRWVVDHASRIPGTDGAIVATSTERQDDAIARYCRRHGIEVFRGSEADVLDRFVRCARERRADAVVRLTADCPLLDPTESGRVIHAYCNLPNCSYANNVSPQSVPAGFGTEVISMAALETSWREASDPADREHVTPFVRRQPERFISTCVTSSLSAPQYRLSLDTLADFTFLSAIVDRLRLRGCGHSVREVLDVVADPDLAVLRIASQDSATREPPRVTRNYSH